MGKKKIFIILSLLAVAFLVTGCGKKTAEKEVETAIEQSTNGQADVDIDNNSITINSNGSTYQASEAGLELPDGFPSDVYVVDGKITFAYTYVQDSNYSITIQTDKSKDELKSLYTEQMKDAGWESTLSLDTTDITTLGNKKGDDRTANVTISKDTATDKWLVTITTLTNS